MITLTPTGDILIDGIKVGKYYKDRKLKPSAKIRIPAGYKYLYEPDKDKLLQGIINRINYGLITKKWKE